MSKKWKVIDVGDCRQSVVGNVKWNLFVMTEDKQR